MQTFKLQDKDIQITSLLNVIGDVTLKNAMNLASTVIHISGTDREKQLGDRIRNNG